MTLVELMVTIAVTGVVIGIAVGFIVGVQQQQLNVHATEAAAQQSELASQLVSYLRAAATPVAGTTETPTNVTVPAYIGTPVGASSPESVTVQILYKPGQPGVLAGTGTLSVIFTGQPPTGPPKVRTVAVYDVLAPNAGSIFTYYEYAPSGSPGVLQQMPVVPITQTCALQKIVAVGIDVSFWGPGAGNLPSHGYAADIAATLDTTIFLRNTSFIFGSTTTAVTTTTLPAGGCQD